MMRHGGLWTGMAVLVLAGCPTKSNPDWVLPAGSGDSTGGTGAGTSTGVGTSTSTSTGASSASTTGTTGDPTRGSTGAGSTGSLQEQCEGAIFATETFDAVPMTGAFWWAVSDGPTTPQSVDGALRVSVDLSATASESAYWVMGTNNAAPPTGAVVVEVVTPPTTTDPAELFLRLNDGSWRAFFDLQGGWLFAGQEDLAGSSLDYRSEIFDPVAHRWLRISFVMATSTFRYETANQPGNWVLFAEESLPDLDLGTAYAEVGIGAWTGPLSTEVGAIDNLTICTD